MKIIIFAAMMIWSSALMAESSDYPTKCSRLCKTDNGSEFCVSIKSPDRTDTTVFYTGPKGDRVITNIYPYSDLESAFAQVLKAIEDTGELYKSSVKGLIANVSCSNKEVELTLSEAPEMHEAF